MVFANEAEWPAMVAGRMSDGKCRFKWPATVVVRDGQDYDP